MLTHKYDKQDHKDRKAAKADLKKPAAPPGTIAALRARVKLLERLVGVK